MNEHDLLLGIVAAAEKALASTMIPADPESKEAWDDLQQRMHGWHYFLLHGSEDMPNVKVKVCRRCGVQFFFARDGHPREDRPLVWVPFEIDPITPDGVLPQWLWTVDFTGPEPIARVSPSAKRGNIYVDHRQTCGLSDGPRYSCLPYVRRYNANVDHANVESEGVIDSLVHLRQELRSPRSHNR